MDKIDSSSRRLAVSLLAIAGTLGAINAWSVRFSMNPDGISYLDLSDALLQSGWRGVINAYWSPLYPVLLGLANATLTPSVYWEFASAHLVNFVVYLLALLSFRYLLNGLIRCNREYRMAARPEESGTSIPDWSWIVVGYTMFMWVSLRLITIRVVSPDMLVSALIYLIVGVLLRIEMGEKNWKTFTLLGCLLGLSYLAKSPMFVMAVLFLGIATMLVRKQGRTIRGPLLSALIFLLISSPLITALSTLKGRVTFGESAKLNYAWYVNGVKGPFHWQGGPEGAGVPEHPTRLISAGPAIYEFSEPVGGTYPAWYDPSYWYEGVTLHFNLANQAAAILQNVQKYWWIFFPVQGGLIVVGVLLCVMLARSGLNAGAIAGAWSVLTPALAGLIMFCLVDVVPRYVGAYVLLLWLGVLSCLSAVRSSFTRKSRLSIVVLILVMPALSLVSSTVADVGDVFHDLQRPSEASNTQFQIADGCARAGLHPGDRVGIIGPAFLQYWARLARVKVIAELPVVDSSCWNSPSVRDHIIGVFVKAGANAVVSEHVPPVLIGSQWRKIEYTDISVYRLP